MEAVIYAAERAVTRPSSRTISAPKPSPIRLEQLSASFGRAPIAPRKTTAPRPAESVRMTEGEGLRRTDARGAPTGRHYTSESDSPADTDHPPKLTPRPMPIVSRSAHAARTAAPTDPRRRLLPTQYRTKDEKRLARQRDREIREEIREIVAESHRRIRRRRPRHRDSRNCRRLPHGHQARIPRRRPRLRQEPQAAA